MKYLDVYTQAGLDTALSSSDVRAVCRGAGYFVAWGSAHVVARESAHVVAWGSAHVAPHPALATEWDPKATRFLACPVLLEDMRPPRDTDEYPNKIKARRVCAPVWEVDQQGRAIVPAAPVATA